MRTAYVQIRNRDIRSLVSTAIEGVALAVLESKPDDPRQLAVAILELPAAPPVAAHVPPWLSASGVPCIGIAATGSEDLAIDVLRNRFHDYLRLPLTASELSAAIARVFPLVQAVVSSRSLDALIGESASMRALREQVAKAAPVRANVLVTGETGTGKELVAQSIHELSPRHARPFVAVNCGAIPESLVESELFGHRRGAFTGAAEARAGLLTQSHAGTLFLDEVSELDLRAQVKLLRVLETREVQPLGEDRPRCLDLRVIAATNHDLPVRVREGAFRGDLFYRLNVVHVEVTPLRDRPEDVPLLIAHYCERFRGEFSRTCSTYSDADLHLLQHYDWPGNVRELRNVVEASFVHSSGRTDSLLELPPVIAHVLCRRAPPDERQLLIEALFVTRWNVSRAAERLHCSRMTIYRKMTQYQLRRPQPRAAIA
jgi:DNA-binding NtrC family response regulator